MEHRKRIASEGYEGDDGYWIYLSRGWVMPPDEHIIAADTKRQAHARLSEVVKCDCPECVAHE